MRILFAVLRVGIAVAIVAAIVGQMLTSLAYWESLGGVDVGAHVVHFFAFFTIESNVLTAVVGLVGAVLLVTRKGDDPVGFTWFRAAVVTYMFTTGVVYNLLLRGVELPQGSTLGWSNEVLHVIAPIYLTLDWFLAPGRTPLEPKRIWAILVFPIVWVVFTLVRGPLATDTVFGNDYWYPYPFLNPNNLANGYLGVTFYVILIALVIAATAAGVLWVSRRVPLPKP